MWPWGPGLVPQGWHTTNPCPLPTAVLATSHASSTSRSPGPHPHPHPAPPLWPPPNPPGSPPSERKDTCCLTAISVSLRLKRHTVLWRAAGLPYDCYRLLPLPQRPAALVLSPSLVMLTSQVRGLGLGGAEHSGRARR